MAYEYGHETRTQIKAFIKDGYINVEMRGNGPAEWVATHDLTFEQAYEFGWSLVHIATNGNTDAQIRGLTGSGVLVK
jgi:hypothetical protein